jgi:hypothetical protein
MKRAVMWVKRVLAVAAALLALAVVIPNIAPRGWPQNREVLRAVSWEPDPLAVTLYVASAAIIVTMIFIGDRRSRIVEWLGWILLAVFVFLAVR